MIYNENSICYRIDQHLNETLGLKSRILLKNHRKKLNLLLVFYLWAAKVKQVGEAVSPTNFPYYSGP